jgi:hypothetical protein
MELNGLNVAKCNEFINNNIKYKQILETLFSNTKYYTHDQIKNMLEHLLTKFIDSRDKNKPLIILLDNNKIGSEHYYYYTLKHLLPEHYICFIDSKSGLKMIDEPCDILFLDDWSLSGCHLLGVIDSALYTKKQETNKNITINIIVGLITK